MTDCMFRFMTNPIPAPIQSLLAVFTTCLADVRFADVDGDLLGRFATEVEAAAETVSAAQSALDAAQGALQERQETLLQQAQRALAYARVYAENDDALLARLEAISLPRPARRTRGEDALVLSADPQPTARPRGRPRKGVVVAPALDEPILDAMLSPAE
jgi:hypothetical protein